MLWCSNALTQQCAEHLLVAHITQGLILYGEQRSSYNEGLFTSYSKENEGSWKSTCTPSSKASPDTFILIFIAWLWFFFSCFCFSCFLFFSFLKEIYFMKIGSDSVDDSVRAVPKSTDIGDSDWDFNSLRGGLWQSSVQDWWITVICKLWWIQGVGLNPLIIRPLCVFTSSSFYVTSTKLL